nr:DUF3450 domain-containing protein [Larsenimonas rhizosphaerae]
MLALVGALGLATLSMPAVGAPTTLRDATSAHQAEQQRLQHAIDTADDSTRALLVSLRDAEQSIHRLDSYNASLEAQVEDQSRRIARQKAELAQAGDIREALPGELASLTHRLRAMVAADLPFRHDERLARLDSLDSMLGSASMSDGQKLKRILSVWRSEIDYGSTLDSWRGKLDGADKTERQVQFVRLGRVGYYYLSLDGDEGGVWQGKGWQPLDHEALSSLRHAVRMAHDQQAPELLTLPLSLPVSASTASTDTSSSGGGA